MPPHLSGPGPGPLGEAPSEGQGGPWLPPTLARGGLGHDTGHGTRQEPPEGAAPGEGTRGVLRVWGRRRVGGVSVYF